VSPTTFFLSSSMHIDYPSSMIETAMRDVYGAKYVSLHVRQTNRAAIGLYRDTLGFTVHDVEKGYCERYCIPSQHFHP
jgi:hypothetical protein